MSFFNDSDIPPELVMESGNQTVVRESRPTGSSLPDYNQDLDSYQPDDETGGQTRTDDSLSETQTHTESEDRVDEGVRDEEMNEDLPALPHDDDQEPSSNLLLDMELFDEDSRHDS